MTNKSEQAFYMRINMWKVKWHPYHPQGEAAHEALISRQDAELRLLENMKRCLTLRVKCDREYAIALNSVVLQAQVNSEWW